jgi:hypothetical protein
MADRARGRQKINTVIPTNARGESLFRALREAEVCLSPLGCTYDDGGVCKVWVEKVVTFRQTAGDDGYENCDGG